MTVTEGMPRVKCATLEYLLYEAEERWKRALAIFSQITAETRYSLIIHVYFRLQAQLYWSVLCFLFKCVHDSCIMIPTGVHLAGVCPSSCGVTSHAGHYTAVEYSNRLSFTAL